MAKAKESRSRSLFPAAAAGGVEEQESVQSRLSRSWGCSKSSQPAMTKGTTGKVT